MQPASQRPPDQGATDRQGPCRRNARNEKNRQALAIDAHLPRKVEPRHELALGFAGRSPPIHAGQQKHRSPTTSPWPKPRVCKPARADHPCSGAAATTRRQRSADSISKLVGMARLLYAQGMQR
jgi:hypothetical protein